MSGGERILAEHYITFLEGLKAVTSMEEWNYDPTLRKEDNPQPTSAENTMQQDALLEEGAILLFEKVSLGNEAEANRRWKVSDDGTVWFSRNRPPVPRDQEFNQDFQRLASLSAEQRQALLETARTAGFWTAPEEIRDDAVEDGMRLRLTIRDQGKVRRIVADNARSEVIEAITAALFKHIETPVPRHERRACPATPARQPLIASGLSGPNSPAPGAIGE